jgi:acetylornithine deacetylase/succinyl-diaminopimelate desuccinylase-like protein
MFTPDAELTDHAFDLCQRLLRIDTTNPPGGETVAAEMLAEELGEAGLEPVVLESAPGRGSVVARLKGKGTKPPLLLTGHLDVVEADPEKWSHPPFSGIVKDGCLWGRGAIDMKNHCAMSVAILTRLAREKAMPERDLIFAGVADEEAGCRMGSLWLCREHEELVKAEYALGEGGGFNIHLAGKEFFTIQVAEKGVCWVKARTQGEPGHGSMPRPDSAVVKLAEAIARLGKQGLPMRATKPVEEFVLALAQDLPGPIQRMLPKLLHPVIAPKILDAILDPSAARGFRAMLGNTASPTVLRAGNKTNVIPNYAEAEIDGRTVPGQTTADILRELQEVLGPEVELEVMHDMPPVVEERTELYDTIVDVMGHRAPTSPVVPYMLPGFTDAKAFTGIGCKWVGFAPVKMPPEIRFADLFHGNDERIPVDGLKWGTETLAEIVARFAGVPLSHPTR